MPRRPDLTRNERLQIHTLRDLGWTYTRIADHLSVALRQVQYIAKQPTMPKIKTGRLLLLDTSKRRELVNYVTASAQARQLAYMDIPPKLDWSVCGETVRKALQKEDFNRRIARQKPLLTDANKTTRLAWARKHFNWSREQWDSVLWTDESNVYARNTYRTWATRRPGEALLEECVAPKVRGGNSWMIWRCFFGQAGLGPLLVWDKDWGKINSETYCAHTLPLIDGWMQQHPGHILMQNNASMHLDWPRYFAGRFLELFWTRMRCRCGSVLP